MLEINGNPNRRDLSERHARLAADAGATIVLNTDAHGVDTLANMVYAIATARRAWLTTARGRQHPHLEAAVEAARANAVKVVCYAN